MTDLALLAEPGALDRYAHPAEFVVLACERARDWLRQAVERGEIDAIKECWSQAEAIRTYTAQRDLGRDAEVAGSEIVVRAIRGLGRVVLDGQDAGTISRPGVSASRNNADSIISAGLPSPIEVFGHEGTRRDAYKMAHADDETFEEVVAEAKAEGNLSRTNVVRCIARRTVLAPTAAAPSPPSDPPAARRPKYGGRPDAMKNTRHLNSRRIIGGAVEAIDGIGMLFEHIDYTQLDPEDVNGWVPVLTESIRSLTTLRNRLKEITQP